MRRERRGNERRDTRSPRPRWTKPSQATVPRALQGAAAAAPDSEVEALKSTPFDRGIPVCALKYLRHPPAVESFHAFLHFFMLSLFLCVEHLLPDTGYTYDSVPSFLCFFRFVFVFLIVCAFLCFVC